MYCEKRRNINGNLTAEEKKANEMLMSLRQDIERINKRVKHFGVMSGVWRGDSRDLFYNSECVHVVCKITNLIMCDEPL